MPYGGRSRIDTMVEQGVRDDYNGGGAPLNEEFGHWRRRLFAVTRLGQLKPRKSLRKHNQL